MKDSLYDRLLIGLAVAGPLAMLVLNAWQVSLDTWYTPLDGDRNGALTADFKLSVSDWAAATGGAGAELVVIVDKSCPCTEATLRRLEEAVAHSKRKDLRIVIRDIHDDNGNKDPPWQKVLRQLPATPTLLSIEGRRLVYAGPVTSGSFCTTTVGKVLGVNALQATRGSTLFDVVEKGCYCRAPGA